MVIFKLVEDYRQIQMGLSRISNSSLNSVDKNRQYIALYSLYEYFDNCSWVKTDKVKEKVRFLIDNNMDKVKLKEEYELNSNSLRCLLHRINKMFCDAIGEDTVSKICDGDYTSIQVSNLETEVDVLNVAYSKSILNQFPRANIKDGVDLRDLKREMKFLEIYNSNTIAKRTSMLAKESLEHIIGLLSSNNPKHTYEKTLLTQLVMGEITMEELISKIDYKEDILK